MLAKKTRTIIILLLAAAFAVFVPVVRAEILKSTTATPTLSDEIIISNVDDDKGLPAIAYNWKHREYLVVWTKLSGIFTPGYIHGARISADGQILDEFPVYGGLTFHTATPDVAYDPVNDRYLVVFRVDKTGGAEFAWDVYGRIIPWDGPDASLTTFPIRTNNNIQGIPKVAYARAQEEFLVVYIETMVAFNQDFFHYQRIDASSGNLIGLYSPVTSVCCLGDVDVTYNRARNEYLVVYDFLGDIVGERYTGEMKALGLDKVIADWPDSETYPRTAACSETNQYLVTWTSDQQSSSGTNAIYGRFVSGTGEVGKVHKLADTAGDETYADVACNHTGTAYLAAWQVEDQGVTTIWGRLIYPDGTLKPKFQITGPDNRWVYPAGGHDGFLTAWLHKRDIYEDIHGRFIITNHKSFLPLIVQ